MVSAEMNALRALAARLGADRLQIQGPGGNVSLKDGPLLRVKASGTRMAEALERDIFAVVPLDAWDAPTEGGLRPSIETALHALIPHRVVLHTHSVAALAHLIAAEGRAAALRALGDLGAVLVPYVTPGRPLADAVVEAGAEAPIHLLANHGLVVSGATVAEAEARLAEVERRLALPARLASAAGRPPEGWTARAPGLAAPRARAVAEAGAYWPDHVVFLGGGLGPDTEPARLHPGGALLREDAPRAAGEMLDCLEDVLLRLPDGWHPEPLPEAEVALLSDWEAEAHRKAMERP
jgi:rhamnose utilization protein RhaD (predicted bifunctional aldolase and dehydrogenase)